MEDMDYLSFGYCARARKGWCVELFLLLVKIPFRIFKLLTKAVRNRKTKEV